MQHITGDARTSAANGDAASSIHMRAGGSGSGGGGRADGESGGRFDDLRERLGEGARGIASSIDRTGVLRTIRDNPVASLGLAFGAGFALALSSAVGDRHWAVERVRRQLRTAVIAGLAAAFADEIKDLVEGNDGLGALVHSFLPDHEDDDAEA